MLFLFVTMLRPVWILPVLLIGFVISDFDIFRSKTIRFYRFDGKCPEYPNAPMYYTNVNVQTRNRTVFVSMKIHITKTLRRGEGVKLHLKLLRCSNRDDLNSCEHFSTVKIKNFCSFVEGDDKPWSGFRKVMTPPIGGCPFKRVSRKQLRALIESLLKGIFVVRNGTFDGSKFDRFPISDWYWRVTVLMLSEMDDSVLMCNLVEGQIAPV